MDAPELPAWRRVTADADLEYRWPATLAVVVAITLHLLLPDALVPGLRWLPPALAVALLVALVVHDPVRITKSSPGFRAASLALIALIGLTNAWSAVLLVRAILDGAQTGAGALLLSGGAIYLTNILAFALLYWELDRGGPGARRAGERDVPDFAFAQMQSPDLAPGNWEPHFTDYLYLAFTNATAFSPTDVLPMTRWAKLTMMLQSAVALVIAAFVVARAINVL
jgi:uncharacterized membrane protein